eukprot:SAG11_NODE_8232_length_1044_cov_0.892063_1_plen_132_part_10
MTLESAAAVRQAGGGGLWLTLEAAAAMSGVRAGGGDGPRGGSISDKLRASSGIAVVAGGSGSGSRDGAARADAPRLSSRHNQAGATARVSRHRVVATASGARRKPLGLRSREAPGFSRSELMALQPPRHGH